MGSTLILNCSSAVNNLLGCFDLCTISAADSVVFVIGHHSENDIIWVRGGGGGMVLTKWHVSP